jgi:hypothetical protein
MKKILFFVFLIFIGCGSHKVHNRFTQPKWIVSPEHHKQAKNKLVGIGFSGVHMNGFRAQRKLAIASAIDEIARQKGVTVSNTLERMQAVSGKGKNSSSSMYSVQSVDGQKVIAKIIDSWQDPQTKDLYILMIGE